MKKLALVSLFLLTLGAANASAQCNTSPTGGSPYFWNGVTFYDYSVPGTCYESYGSGSENITDTTLSCGYGGWQFGYGNYAAKRWTFTLPSNANIVNPDHWKVSEDVELVSPDQSWWDHFELSVTITHPDNSQSLYTIFDWNGTQGNLNGCSLRGGLFTAHAGDTIMIEVRANQFGNATIKADTPTIDNQS
jgi:hypothetical protein